MKLVLGKYMKVAICCGGLSGPGNEPVFAAGQDSAPI